MFVSLLLVFLIFFCCCYACIVTLLLGAAGGARVGAEERECASASQSSHGRDVQRGGGPRCVHHARARHPIRLIFDKYASF